MSCIPPWAVMPKWQLKLMDLMTPASRFQADLDYLLSSYSNLKVRIKDGAVFVFPIKAVPTTADHAERFPLSKLRTDQLNKLREIMEDNMKK